MSEALLKLLGVETEADGCQAVSAANAFLAEVRATCGTQQFAECIASIKANAKMVTDIEAATGKTGAEAIGAVVAFRAGYDEAAKLREQVQAQRDAQAKAEKDGLIASALDSGKLTSGMQPWAESVDIETLKGFLEVAPPAVPGGGTPQVSEPENDHSGIALNDYDLAFAAEMGKSPAEYRAELIKSRKAMKGVN